MAWATDIHSNTTNLSQLPPDLGSGFGNGRTTAPQAVGTTGVSSTQFYVRRDHTLGSSASGLDRLRSHHDFPRLKTFAEVEEEKGEVGKYYTTLHHFLKILLVNIV